MEKKKSPRNKTIDFGEEEGRIYIDRAIAPEDIGEDTVNVTVNGDLFEAAKRMKKKSVDLIVADPPYNLDKTFTATNSPPRGRKNIPLTRRSGWTRCCRF